jgi:hypothetical protein
VTSSPEHSDIDAAVRKLIDAAVRKLPIIPEQVWKARELVDYLMRMWLLIAEKGSNLHFPPNWRPATKPTVIKELIELERRASELANKIDKGAGRSVQASNWPDIFEDCIFQHYPRCPKPRK